MSAHHGPRTIELLLEVVERAVRASGVMWNVSVVFKLVGSLGLISFNCSRRAVKAWTLAGRGIACESMLSQERTSLVSGRTCGLKLACSSVKTDSW